MLVDEMTLMMLFAHTLYTNTMHTMNTNTMHTNNTNTMHITNCTLYTPSSPPPVMSSNGDTNVVFRGVTHGAVDFLIKPVRVEELRNLWQHVVRKTLGGHGSQAADRNHSEEVDGDDEHKRQERKRKESVVRWL